MPDFSKMTIPDLIRPGGYACDCGRRHACSIKYLNIGNGILHEIPAMIDAMGCKRPYVVCDDNTWRVLGEQVHDILTGAGIAHGVHVVPLEKPDRDRISPAEWELGGLIMNYDPDCDMFLAVGSGVINDLCKVAANATGKPTAIVGTAPSMDGFASHNASMEVNNVKLSLNEKCPEGILLDTGVMAQAPMRMLWAGLGDMTAKYTAICEWRISHIVTGEYYCEDVAGLMRSALRRVMAAADRIPQRDPEAISAVAEGLVQAGISMAYAGISRPASGMEHYFSHMWEMMALDRGKPYDLHGIQVAVGTVQTMRLYRKLLEVRPDRAVAEAHMRAFDQAAWESSVRHIFGRTADQLIAMEKRARKNDPVRHAARLDRILASWDDIQGAIREELPDFEAFYGRMSAVGIPLEPGDIDISDDDVIDAFVGARDSRDKYLLSSLIWDLGLMDEFGEYLRAALASGRR